MDDNDRYVGGGRDGWLNGGGGTGVADPPGGGGIAEPPEGSEDWGPPASPDDAPALRCSVCGIDWPPYVELFDRTVTSPAQAALFMRDAVEGELECPACLAPVHPANNLNPIPPEEAWSLKNHADFGRYYARTRGIQP